MVEATRVVLPAAQTICTWRELAECAERYSDGSWIFRGVTRQEHLLIPGIGREANRRNGFTGASRRFDNLEERGLLETFKRQAQPYITYAPQSDIEWLAIAQHHGMVTRLLDWTESLYIAAYF